MSKLFLGKLTIEDQYNNNYYECSGPNYQSWIGDLKVGDYVLPNKGEIRFLLKCIEIKDSGFNLYCTFDKIKEFYPPITLSSNIAKSVYIKLDLNLLNKVYKSTKGISFHELILEEPNLNPETLDFTKTRDFYCVLKENYVILKNKLKENDILITISDRENLNIESIDEFKNGELEQYIPLWSLYNEKINEDKKYSIRELYNYSLPENDNAKNKTKYLTNLINSLENELYFIIDLMMSFYDNVLVGRKKSAPAKIVNGVVKPSLTTDDVSDISEYERYVNILKFTPNLILYGPPGTGKTYSLSRIIEAFEQSEGRLKSFDDIEKEGRVQFLTFHQSYSYEEFIEGLRPYSDDNQGIKYRVEPGILRTFIENQSINASSNLEVNKVLNELGVSGSNKVWRFSLGLKEEKRIYNYFKNSNQIGIGHGDNVDFNELSYDQRIYSNNTLKRFAEEMQIGDFVCIFNDVKTIRLVGIISSEYFFDNEVITNYPHRRKVVWIENFEENPFNILSLNNNMKMTPKTLSLLNFGVSTLLEKIVKNDINYKKMPIYLIIDEINRGNISKIFGELITLIEKDKRETLYVSLPYSKQKFSIPSNLYIIGTMNTSDRSITLLDTALRRRFAFIEMIPDYKLVENFYPTIGGHVSPSKLLSYLNQRIIKMIDRDHVIGHSYFIGESMVKEDLYNAWYYQIIPLILEYFYFDFKKLNEIVGDFVNLETNSINYFESKTIDNRISVFEEKLVSLYTKNE